MLAAARLPAPAAGARGPPRPEPIEHSMTTTTWLTLIAVTAFVWGGFALALWTAIRSESGKD